MDKHTEELLLNSTSIIYTVDRHNNRRKATCFFVRTIINGTEEKYLVTNKHVLMNKEKAILYLNRYNKITKKFNYNYKVEITMLDAVEFHEKYDLAVLNINFLDNLNTETETLEYTTVGLGMIPNDYNIFSNIQSIIILGYPDGLYNANYNLPIVRTGITSTPIKNTLKNKDEFIIDVPTIGGSSGSPIFAEVDNKLYLIGVVYCTLRQKFTIDRYGKRLYHSSKYTVKIDGHLGIAIRSNQIRDFIHSLLGKTNKNIEY